MDEKLSAIYNAILDGDVTGAKDSVQTALTSGLEPGNILDEGMIAAMTEVGRRFEAGDYYVPEMLVAACAMQAALSLLKPRLIESDVKSAGKVAIGTVKGDLHDIGKNLVALMLEGAGFEIKDLGVDVPIEEFIRVVREEKPDIVGMSALLTTTMQMMKQTIDAFQAAGLRDQVKFIIGGAPVTETYANQIGADGFSPDASRAVNVAKSLLGG